MQKFQVSIIPEILNMPLYSVEETAYIPINFFTELGVPPKEIDVFTALSDWKQGDSSETERVPTNTFTSLIPYDAASKLISQLAANEKYSIFRIISTKLFLKSLEAGTIKIEDLADEFKKDINYWQSKINSLDRDCNPQNFIPFHPDIESIEIERLRYQSPEWESYLELNPSYVSYRLVYLIAEPSQDENLNRQVNDYLRKCLYYHNRHLEYYYFLYHILTRDESLCLLIQTLLTEWFQKDRDLVPLHLI